MVSASLSKLGKTSIHFITPSAKINSAYYCNEVLSQLLPEMEQLSNGDYIFQQDGARSQTAKITITYLEEHCCKFLKPDFWPPNSRDLLIMLSVLNWKPKTGRIIDFRSQLFKI